MLSVCVGHFLPSLTIHKYSFFCTLLFRKLCSLVEDGNISKYVISMLGNSDCTEGGIKEEQPADWTKGKAVFRCMVLQIRRFQVGEKNIVGKMLNNLFTL